MKDLDGRQVRQLIDVKQLYETLLRAEKDYAHSFKGSMSWKRVHGADYLYRKRSDDWKSLGPRSVETERLFASFQEGREAAKARIAALREEIERMAPISRAMGLGRMPSIGARILRRLQSQGIMGRGLQVVGTHALFAYESLVSAHFKSDDLATADIDLLYDAGASLKMASAEILASGLIGQLQKVDRSFAAPAGSFRAANDAGFMVDLIMPQPKLAATTKPRRRIGQDAKDQAAAEIEGLAWLQNSTSIEEIAIDENGLPFRIATPDPRAFAIHKAWLSKRADREPGKRRRDLAQARAVASMVGRYLPDLKFDDEALAAFPAEVRRDSLPLLSEPRAASTGVAADW